MTDTEMTAAERIKLARDVGARILADPAAYDCQDPDVVAGALMRAAEQRNRMLGLVQDTPEAAAQRESARRARVQAVIDQMPRG